MRHLRIFGAGLVLVISAALGVAAAFGAFSPAQTLSNASEDSWSPAVAMDTQGNSVVVWDLLDQLVSPRCQDANIPCIVQARARAANGTLGPLQAISDTHFQAYVPAVAMNATGTSAFVWAQDDGKRGCAGGFEDCTLAKLRVRSPGGSLSAIQTLSPAGHDLGYDGPQVAIDPQGRAYAVWARAPGAAAGDAAGVVEARVRSAAGALGPIQLLSSNGQAQRVFVTPQGSSLFFWYQNPTNGFGQVVVRARSSAGAWGVAQAIPGPRVYDYQVAADASGNSLVIWKGDDSTTHCGQYDCAFLYARYRSAAGVLGPIVPISPGVQNDGSSPLSDWRVAMGSAGNAIIVWSQNDETTGCANGLSGCYLIRARTRAPNGALGPVLTLSETHKHGFIPQAAVDSRGNAMVVWQRQYPTDSSCSTNCLLIQGRAISKTNVLGPLQTLSAGPGAAASPAVAVDPNGGTDLQNADAVAAWNRFDSTKQFCCFRIQDRAQIAP